MGLLGLASLIPGMTGDLGKAFFMLAWDFLDEQKEAREREEQRRIEEYNRKHAITQSDLPQFASWAFGEEFLSADADGDCGNRMVRQWNVLHGRTLFLYIANGHDHNFEQMMNLWVNLGKPIC